MQQDTKWQHMQQDIRQRMQQDLSPNVIRNVKSMLQNFVPQQFFVILIQIE